MHAINFIGPSLPEIELPCEVERNVCCVTGVETPCIPRKLGILETFTNQDLFNAPQSEWIGIDAFKVLHYRPERASSWYSNGTEFRLLNRGAVRDLVLKRDYDKRWCAYATTSYKKHGSLWATVNTHPDAIWRFEMLDVDCSDRERVGVLWDNLSSWLLLGIGRRVLGSLAAQPFLIRKIGVRPWIEFERWARPLYRSPLYLFLCYLLPSREEVDAGHEI